MKVNPPNATVIQMIRHQWSNMIHSDRVEGSEKKL